MGGVMPSSKRMSASAFRCSLPKSKAILASAKEEKAGTTGSPLASFSTSTAGSGLLVRWNRPAIISWAGMVTGRPSEGLRMLLALSIKMRASDWASAPSGRCTAIWSPSKSALKGAHTSGCSWIALPSISWGSKAWIPRRCRVGARLSSTGCSRITSASTSQTSGLERSTIRLAALTF